MAKDPDNLAAAFDTESTGGLLAEEDAFDRRLLWRIGSWGFAAVGAVVIAVMANQSSLTLRRDQLAAADIAQQTQQLRNITRESHSEARRLASAIDTLSGDRDRLYARVTSLEQNLDSVTGAIAKQATATAATTPGAPAAPVNQPPAQPAAPAPAVAPVATVQPDKPVPAEKAATTPDKTAVPPDKPSASVEKPTDKAPAPAGKVQPVADAPAAATDHPSSPGPVAMSPASAAAGPVDKKPSASAPLVAEKSMTGPPDPAAGKLTEPAKPPAADHVTSEPIPVVMADPDSQVDDEADAPKAQVRRTEFGVDLGTANSVNGLRALWRGLLKSKGNAPLAALRPIIVIKESGNGLGMQLRLVAGPLNDAGTAAKICASLSPIQRTCETAIYDGQRLSLNEPPAAVRPAHRRFVPKRAAVSPPPAPVAAEEKKPEPTAFSSMFRRNNQ